ncbi:MULTISPECIES: lectin-like domain-containing protein [unclassified Enterococcus]|uniref:lectin-like domain-containing protein n=1 Tax=unclassified Enterococcus TaxID=2608891 RepID=UPI001CE16136|nr:MULTISPECIES: WxL domain-containing protein [unclassified Enterococcus]MCA5013553.1 WxL domain-containing protein [Enterococcus sp. S23]MCA5016803.1 WxL domain-containing protein [Enterococcus sp. S22(2020)]
MLEKIKKAVFVAIVAGILCVPLKAEALGYVDAPQSIPLDQIFVTPKGANSYVEGNNVVITDKKARQIGSIFSTEANKMELSKDFESEMYVYLDGNADGMAFVMHNDPNVIANFTGQTGGGLAVYAGAINPTSSALDGKQIKKSFAIEFDTYYNGGIAISGDYYDSDVLSNAGKGHIAYAFPDQTSSYDRNGSFPIIKHLGLQYPTFKLGDAKWRLLNIKWTKWNSTDVGYLTYTFGDMDPVTVAISKDIFGADNVYWGFTGSTGGSYEKAVIAFKSVPGLVQYNENMTFENNAGQEIQSITQDSEVTVHYTGRYAGGKQNMFQPVYKFTLAPNQLYQQGTFLLNGVPVTPIYLNNELQIPLSKDLSETDATVDIQFKIKDTNVTTDQKLVVASQTKAKNFISDKVASYEITYDAEAPIGLGKLTFIERGDTQTITEAKEYDPFFWDYQDDYSSKENIDIRLKTGQDIEKIVSAVGPSSFILTLTDEKGNARDITIPIFIEDQTTVKSNKYIIQGKDLSVTAKEYPKTQQDLETLIHQRGALKLWQYNGVEANELDSTQLTLSLGTLPKPPTLAGPGVYPITAFYGTGVEKVEKPLNVTVIQSFATVKISFVDENDQPIIEDFSFEANVSEQIDLTKNQELLEKLNAVKALNYVKDTAPSDEKNLLILPEGVSRKYTFKGTLFIESAPNTIDFGDQKVSGQNKKFTDPIYDQHLVIWDNRSTLGTWKITLKQSQDFSLTGNEQQRLPNALSYQTADAEKVISTEAQEVFRSKHQASGKYDISGETWGPNKQGLRFNAPIGSIKQTGNYETTLTWQIEEAY